MRYLLVLLLALPALAGCLGSGVDSGEEATPTPRASGLVYDANGNALPDTTPIGGIAADSLSASRFEVGVEAFEPTLGIGPEGDIYFATTHLDGAAVGWGPGVMRSLDGGETWEDVSPELPTGANPPETNDPFLHVDPETGRVYQFPMAPILTCGVLSWSDDQGESWFTNPRGCGNTPPWDHQALTTANPVLTPTVGYDRVVHQCVNNVAAAWCSQSFDGGLTWAPFSPPFAGIDPEGLCGGLHGHIVSGPEGYVYLPKNHCNRGMLARSMDDGITWTQHTAITGVPAGDPDPAMAVDEAGNVYYGATMEDGRLVVAISRDHGDSWMQLNATLPGVVSTLPALAALGENVVVAAYPGAMEESAGSLSGSSEWFPYFTVIDFSNNDTVITTMQADSDVINTGACGHGDRCSGLVDFIDVVVGKDGLAYAAFVDSQNEAGEDLAILVRLNEPVALPATA